MKTMKAITIMVSVLFALAALILLIDENKCEEGYHSMPDGTCMSNMEMMH